LARICQKFDTKLVSVFMRWTDFNVITGWPYNDFKGRVQCFSLQVVMNKCFLLNLEKNEVFKKILYNRLLPPFVRFQLRL